MPLKQFFTSKGSLMTEEQTELYLSPTKHLDFTYGYPERINPAWIKKLQANVPKKIFQDEAIAPVYINQIETYFKHLFRTDRVSLATTASFAIAFMCDAVIRNPGDEIIVQDVSFEPYPRIIESYKGKPVVVDRQPDFLMSLKNIKEAYTNKTKAVIIVNPDNPLGLIYDENDMRQLAEFCIEKNITLVVDYTFIQISQPGKKVPLITTFPESKQLSYILIGDTGKILGLKGAKFGALLYSPEYAELIKNVVSYYFFQYNQYNLYLVSSILEDKRFTAYLQHLNSVLAENYAYIGRHLHTSLKLCRFDATVFCLINIEATGFTDIALTRSLISKGIGVIPLSDFYYGGKTSSGNYIRLSLSRPLNEIKKFVEVLNGFVA